MSMILTLTPPIAGIKQDQGSLIADPEFADVSNLNFTLPSSSPAHQVTPMSLVSCTRDARVQIGFVPIDVSSVGPRR